MNALITRAGDALSLALTLDPPRFGLRPEALFALAARQNRDRAFLFVSKVLGKHLPIHPGVLWAAGKLLALAYTGQDGGEYWAGIVNGENRPSFPALWEKLGQSRYHLGPDRRTLFVGFAETATGLARAAADAFRGEMAYISTTRLRLDRPSLTFSESHSHAKEHYLYLDGDPFLKGCRQAALVDDELTTGNTSLKVIEALHQAYGIRRFILFTILDWSGGEGRAALEKRLGIQIQVASLLRGRIQEVVPGEAPREAPVPYQGAEGDFHPTRLPANGTIGQDRLLLGEDAMERQRALIREAASRLEPGDGDTLYLGTGELIYLPALAAGFSGGTHFHSTTQSPIFPVEASAITCGAQFNSPDTYSATGYLYQVPPNAYRRAVIFAEEACTREAGLRQLAGYLKSRGIRRVEAALC